MAFPDGLNALVEDGIIDEVHSRLMSGKEAAVFVVEYQGALVAAKVYKSRERRTFKATASYTEGRNQTRSSRDQRAMAKRSNYGRELVEETWREMEYRALFDAFHGGVRVPKPIMLYEDVLLMDLVLDDGESPAPRLADFELAPEHAEAMFREIYEQARRLLATGRIHGDLSAFNILIAKDGPTIIDLPQVIDAAKNNQARHILRRDLANIAEHLAKYDARLLRFRDAGDALFHHFQRGTLDQATEPQAGDIRRHDRPQGGRRAELAERGRMNREGNGRRQNFETEHPGGHRMHPPNQERPRMNGPRVPDARSERTEESHQQARATHEFEGRRLHQGPRNQGPRNQDSKHHGPRNQDSKHQGPRNQDSRNQDSKHHGPRNQDSRHQGPRHQDSRHQGPRYQDSRHQGPRPQDSRHPDSMHQDSRPPRGRVEKERPTAPIVEVIRRRPR